MALFAPVHTRHWLQKELYDGTYTVQDLLDYQEMMAVCRENQLRRDEAERAERM